MRTYHRTKLQPPFHSTLARTIATCASHRGLLSGAVMPAGQHRSTCSEDAGRCAHCAPSAVARTVPTSLAAVSCCMIPSATSVGAHADATAAIARLFPPTERGHRLWVGMPLRVKTPPLCWLTTHLNVLSMALEQMPRHCQQHPVLSPAKTALPRHNDTPAAPGRHLGAARDPTTARTVFLQQFYDTILKSVCSARAGDSRFGSASLRVHSVVRWLYLCPHAAGRCSPQGASVVVLAAAAQGVVGALVPCWSSARLTRTRHHG